MDDDKAENMDTTSALLAMNLPGVEVDAFVDSEEDEVFFGDRSEKEDQGFKKRNLKAVRRTVQLGHAKSAKPLVKPMSSIEEDEHCSELPDKENECASPDANKVTSMASSPAKKTPLKDLQVVSSPGVIPTPSPRKINALKAADAHEGPTEVATVEAESEKVPTPKPRPINTTTPDTAKRQTPIDANPRISQLKEPRVVKSASKLLENLPSPLRNQIGTGEESEDDPSILDVADDQLFDDSLFTAYDESNLSGAHLTTGSASTITSKSWKQVSRQERRKTGNFREPPTITSIVEEKSRAASRSSNVLETPSSSPDLQSVVPETPSNPGVPTAVPETPSDPDVRTVVPESPSSSDLTLESEEKPGKNDESVTSTCSDWFNTTREEMVLYEKFGENYDDVVNQMSHAEKEKLKEEVKNTKAKTEEELMAMAGKNLNQDDLEGQEEEMVVEEEEKVATPSTSLFVPPIATQSQDEEMEEEVSSPSTSMFVPAIETLTPRPQTQTKATTSDQSLGTAIAKASAIKGTYDKSQATSKASSSKAASSGSLPRDHLAPGSTQKRGLLTPGFRTPSASRVKTNSGSSLTKTVPNYLRPTQSSRRKDLSPSKAAQESPATRPLFPNPLESRTPSTIRNRVLGGLGGTPRLYDHVQSPVAEYISIQPPPLVKTIRPKQSKFLEEELEETLEEASPGKKPKFAPLPEAKYVPSRVALEQKLTPTSEQKELPKAFGATKETQVTVVKHLGRVRVPKQAVSEVSSAEDVELKKAPTRESMAPTNNTMDESTMEVSMREVIKVKARK